MMDPSFKPLKRFGQNFLADKNILRKIIAAVSLTKKDCVLEIGPGTGALTFDLACVARRLVAVEVDRRLCAALAREAGEVQNIEIVCADILKFDLKKYARKNKIKKFKVVANLPYYITTPVLEYLFENIGFLDDVFVMVQKEVAQRMTAAAGDQAYGSLSCFVNYHCQPSLLFAVKKGSFWPAPKVDSSFLRLRPRAPGGKKALGVRSEALLFKVIRSAFGQRRKKLYSSLACLVSKDELLGLPAGDLLDRRPEELRLEDFIRLSNLIHPAYRA